MSWADTFLRTLKDNDVRLVTYVPDNVLTPPITSATASCKGDGEPDGAARSTVSAHDPPTRMTTIAETCGGSALFPAAAEHRGCG
jgi:hypothetical protein